MPAADIGFRNQADLVVVPVTITTDRGETVSGLKDSQFRVKDNGESRPAVSFEQDQRALSVVVVVDTNAGMGSSMEQTQLALRNFVASAGPLDEEALLTFSRLPQLVSDFTHDLAPLISNLVSERSMNDSALSDALWQALQVVQRGHNPRKAIVVITDGRDNNGRHTSGLIKAVRDSDVQVYGVAIHYESLSMKRFGNGLLQSLATESGGLSFEIRSAKHLPETVQKIADATRSLYRIGFSPSAVNDRGRWHRIQVCLAVPNRSLRIDAKSGYKQSEAQ